MKYEREELEKFNLLALRYIARAVGVARPTTKKKAVLIDEILLIQNGEMEPTPLSKKGQPVKTIVGTIKKEEGEEVVFINKITLDEMQKQILINAVVEAVKEVLKKIL